MVVSKLLYRVFNIIMIAIISHRSCSGVIAVWKCLQKYWTSAKICITDLSYPLGFLILR